jgi:hypothetical protein
LKDDHVFALPYAPCLSTFRAPGWGTPAILPFCRQRDATSRKLVPFSHRSASRIFIMQPGRIPSPVVTQDGDHQPLGGEEQAGLRSWSRPQLQGCSSSLLGAEAGLSRSSTSHAGSWVSLPFNIQGRGCSLALRAGRTSTTRGWSTAGVASFGTLGSPAWLPVPPPAARAVVAPCARVDRPRHRTPLGWRSCSGAVLPLHRYGAPARRSVLRSSGRIRVGIYRWADGSGRRCRGGCGLRSPRRRRDHCHHPRSGPPALCTCPRPSSVGVGVGKVAASSALRPSLLLWGRNRSSVCNGTLSAGVLFIAAVGA